MSTETPPAYTSTLHDDTHRGKWPWELSIASMGNRPNLVGYLEHHAATTDGSFSICMAGGNGVFVQKARLEVYAKRYLELNLSFYRPYMSPFHKSIALL